MATTPRNLKAGDSAIKILETRIKSADATPEFKALAKKQIARYKQMNSALESNAMKQYRALLRAGHKDEAYKLGLKIKDRTVSYADLGMNEPSKFKQGMQNFEEKFGGDNLVSTVKGAMALAILDVLGADILAKSVVTGLAESGALANLLPTLITFAMSNPVAAVCLVAVAYLGIKKLFGPIVKKMQAKMELNMELDSVDLENADDELLADKSLDEFISDYEKEHPKKKKTPKKEKTEESLEEEEVHEEELDEDELEDEEVHEEELDEDELEDEEVHEAETGSDTDRRETDSDLDDKDKAKTENSVDLGGKFTVTLDEEGEVKEISIVTPKSKRGKAEATKTLTPKDLGNAVLIAGDKRNIAARDLTRAENKEKEAENKYKDALKAYEEEDKKTPRNSKKVNSLRDKALQAQKALEEAQKASKEAQKALDEAQKLYESIVERAISAQESEDKKLGRIMTDETKDNIRAEFDKRTTPTADVIKGWFKKSATHTAEQFNNAVSQFRIRMAGHILSASARIAGAKEKADARRATRETARGFGNTAFEASAERENLGKFVTGVMRSRHASELTDESASLKDAKLSDLEKVTLEQVEKTSGFGTDKTKEIESIAGEECKSMKPEDQLKFYQDKAKNLETMHRAQEAEKRKLERDIKDKRKKLETVVKKATMSGVELSEKDYQSVLNLSQEIMGLQGKLSEIVANCNLLETHLDEEGKIKQWISRLEEEAKSAEEAKKAETDEEKAAAKQFRKNGSENKKTYQNDPKGKIIDVLGRRAVAETTKEDIAAGRTPELGEKLDLGRAYTALHYFCTIAKDNSPEMSEEIAKVSKIVEAHCKAGKFKPEEKLAIESLLKSQNIKSHSVAKEPGFSEKSAEEKLAWYDETIGKVDKKLDADAFNRPLIDTMRAKKTYGDALNANGWEKDGLGAPIVEDGKEAEFEGLELAELTAATTLLNYQNDDRERAEWLKLRDTLESEQFGVQRAQLVDRANELKGKAGAFFGNAVDWLKSPRAHGIKKNIQAAQGDIENLKEHNDDGKLVDQQGASAYNMFMSSFNNLLKQLLDGTKKEGKNYSQSLESVLKSGKLPQLCEKKPALKELFDSLIEVMKNLEKVSEKTKSKEEAERRAAIEAEAERFGLDEETRSKLGEKISE